MDYILFYILGVLVSYLLLSRSFRKLLGNKYNFGDVLFCSFISLASWIAFLPCLVTFLILYPNWNNSKEPPKWM